MLSADILGYLACGLILAAFCMRAPLPLRLFALLSNLTFIAYAYLASLQPVLLLHLILLPVNAYRLGQLLRSRTVATEQARVPGSGAIASLDDPRR